MSMSTLRFLSTGSRPGSIAKGRLALRMTLSVVLCLLVVACGARTGRDLSLKGAYEKFDDRRMETRARAAREDDASQQGDGASADKRLPQRRETLQVRVPTGLSPEDVADGIVSASISGGAAQANSAGRPLASVEVRALESQLRSLQKKIEVKQRDLRGKQSVYDAEKLVLDEMDERHRKARMLLLQGFKIANEQLLQQFLAGLRQEYDQTQPETILGLAQNADLNALALFGRNELAEADEYVDLKKSFIFVGGDVSTGISLGRMDELSNEVGSRILSVNLAGLRLPTALKSLARSMSLPIYLSPGVEAATQRVRLEISKADALDIFDIIIDNYGLALAYDRKMGIARFYTREEFATRMAAAVEMAEEHNKRARNMRKISNLENDEAAIRQIYLDYFQRPDDAGRARSLMNDALVEANYSPGVSQAIISFKQTALTNEGALAALDATHSAERRGQAKTTRDAQFALQDIKAELAKLMTRKLENQRLLTAAKENQQLAEAASQADDGDDADTKPVQQAAGTNLQLLRARVIQDANLKTTEPIFTEKFTIYNSEGSNACGGESTDRVAQIREELIDYFSQLYPDALIAAERMAEREEQRRLDIAEGRIAAPDAVQTPQAPQAGDEQPDATADDAGGQASQTPSPAPDQSDAQGSVAQGSGADTLLDQEAAFSNSGFRRPKITSVADTIIVTAFKHDIELAGSLITNLDQADKQVLVEVFMVNVVKNWQRQLQSRLLNVARDPARVDADLASLPDSILSANPTIVDTDDSGRFGIGGALAFANTATASNSFSINDFKMGLGWTIDFMESNGLGRKVSSPTILALDGCPAKIVKSETRYLPIQTTTAPVVQPGGTTVAGGSTTEYQERTAELKLEVTPKINPLNDHVRLKVNFNDDFFLTSDPNSDKIQSVIDTEFVSAPGDVIVLAGLYTENNAKSRNGLPGTTGVPLLSSILGSTTDQLKSEEMVIFLAPAVITPEAGVTPVNSAEYFDAP